MADKRVGAIPGGTSFRERSWFFLVDLIISAEHESAPNKIAGDGVHLWGLGLGISIEDASMNLLMDRRRRLILAVGSRYPQVARRRLQTELVRFRADPDRFLRRLIATWSVSDRQLFERKDVYDLFMKDLHQVFTEGQGPESLAQELTLYRNYGFSLKDLPAYRRITLWQGLDDNIVPPAMAWQLIQALPNREAHFVPGGHFVAVDIAGQIITRLMQLLDGPADLPAPAPVGREIQ
jgi:pimeloyl-ACP methyl ester carboxylesterase